MPEAVHTHLESALVDELASRDAAAFVHVGTRGDPDVRYCTPVESRDNGAAGRTVHAVAFDPDRETWLSHSSESTAHPAEALAAALSDSGLAGTVLTPPRIPHDAALFLEQAGFALASTEVLERARATKTEVERDRIAAAQRAASAGIRRGAELLAEATVDADGRLEVGGRELTPERLRIAIDEAIVTAGAFPAGHTRIESGSDGALLAGEPIELSVAPREPGGYHGALVRTLVVEGEGGPERRAHVGVTHAFRSSEAMLTADAHSVTAVEADLEAEVRAFGVVGEGNVETDVSGVGLEPHEPPVEGSDEVGPGSVVRLEAAGRVDGARVRVTDVLVVEDTGVEWLAAPSRSLEPTALLE